MRRALPVILAALASVAAGGDGITYLQPQPDGRYTLADRLAMHSADVAARLSPAFAAAGMPYPPADVALIAIKRERKLHVYARQGPAAPWVFIKTYPVLRQSGGLGPKLREGDFQVPEGVYRAEFLNPNSLFHVSIRLNYPNEWDRAVGSAEGRFNLGSDIMIHGSTVSTGCLAMGNEAAEDLFVLAALVSVYNVRIVISPVDFRRRTNAAPPADRPWVRELYAALTAELRGFPLPMRGRRGL